MTLKICLNNFKLKTFQTDAVYNDAQQVFLKKKSFYSSKKQTLKNV